MISTITKNVLFGLAAAHAVAAHSTFSALYVDGVSQVSM